MANHTDNLAAASTLDELAGYVREIGADPMDDISFSLLMALASTHAERIKTGLTDAVLQVRP